MLAAPLQAEIAFLGIGLALLLVLLVTLASAVEYVGADERRALFVFGEYRDVIEPGLTVVPPFVSRTEPIATEPQTVEIGLEGVETADGATLSLIARMEVRVDDAEAAYAGVDDFRSAFVDAGQSATRDAVRRHELAAIRDDAGRLEGRIRESLSASVDDWGLAVPAVRLELAA